MIEFANSYELSVSAALYILYRVSVYIFYIVIVLSYKNKHEDFIVFVACYAKGKSKNTCLFIIIKLHFLANLKKCK